MKKSKIPYYPSTTIICTDGSTLEVNFPYLKNDFYINPDIKSNPIWLPTTTDIELDGLANKSSKFKNYEFDFESLVSPEKKDAE